MRFSKRYPLVNYLITKNPMYFSEIFRDPNSKRNEYNIGNKYPDRTKELIILLLLIKVGILFLLSCL